MAQPLDVAGRLAEGRAAIEHTQSYVRACAQAGYQYPDLPGGAAQIHDWYAGEDGLDLRALDADCAALRAAEAVITEALRSQRDQLTGLATVWAGAGADRAVAFMRQHCDVAGMLVSEVRAAAQRCESLRDNLWQLVDTKVATTTAIDDRTLAQRPTWLAAAAAVATETSARELVDQQIKPYVDNDIRHDFRAAMLSTRSGVTAAYETVTDRFAGAPRAHFETPGDFGPATFSGTPTGPARSTFTPAPPTAAPPPAIAPAFTSPPGPTTGLTQPDWTSGWSGGSGVPGAAGGLSGGAGLGGLAERIVAAMGDLLGSAAGRPGNDPLDDDADDRQEPDPPEEHEGPKKSPPSSPAGDLATAAAQPASQTPPATGPPGPALPPAQVPPADSPAPAPAASAGTGPAPNPAASTPCQIAANELPQAGQ